MAKDQLRPLRDPAQRNVIINAIANYDVSNSNAWASLSKLSRKTNVDAIEANTESIFEIGKNRFEAIATVYVVLNYGGKDGLSTTDSFPVHVAGTFGGVGGVKIDDFSVDTSSFYGEAERG